MYLNNHCQAQEFNDNFPRSYEREKIFSSGNTLPMKIKVGFYFRERCGLCLFFVFNVHHSSIHPHALAFQNKEGFITLPFFYTYVHYCQQSSLFYYLTHIGIFLYSQPIFFHHDLWLKHTQLKIRIVSLHSRNKKPRAPRFESFPRVAFYTW